MTSNDKKFVGSIPDLYDTYLVPLIFEDYAEDMAGRVVAGASDDVLETAAGSGVVTRMLAPLLPSGARYVVSDLNAPMLDRARARQTPDARISWQQADALDLPFEDGAFDVVCCQFGTMFFPDKPKGYGEARRVLRPGGRFIFNVWDGIEHNEFADIVTRVAQDHLPGGQGAFLARTPHGHGDPAVLRRDLEQAGFTEIAIETITRTSTAAQAAHPAIAYAQGTPLRGEIEPHGPEMLERITEDATQEITRRFGAGPVSAKVQGLVITAS